MTHNTLVTILGKPPIVDGEPRYREATYRFPGVGDDQDDRTAFFGLALARHLKPDKIVVLGTASSMWSRLVEELAVESDCEDVRIMLMDADKVDQPLLDRLRPLMGRAMNADVVPRLISEAKTEQEQYAILETVNDAVDKDSGLDFDVTHGFRHLGMVGFMSSFMLERLRGLRVRAFWYGALEMTQQEITPVLRLDGLLRVRRWLDALDKFDATGNYGAFAPLLQEDGVPDDKVGCLEAAAFYERTLNVKEAASKIRAFLPILDETLAGASGLFQERLARRLRWAEDDQLSVQQRTLAQQYLARGDFLRAAVFGKEACVSRLLEENGLRTNDVDGQLRRKTLKGLEERLFGVRGEAYWNLSAMRNALAHVSPPDSPAIEAKLSDSDGFREALLTTLRLFFDRTPHGNPTAIARERNWGKLSEVQANRLD